MKCCGIISSYFINIGAKNGAIFVQAICDFGKEVSSGHPSMFSKLRSTLVDKRNKQDRKKRDQNSAIKVGEEEVQVVLGVCSLEVPGNSVKKAEKKAVIRTIERSDERSPNPDSLFKKNTANQHSRLQQVNI